LNGTNWIGGLRFVNPPYGLLAFEQLVNLGGALAEVALRIFLTQPFICKCSAGR
jgi:hypothetical protein